MSDKEKDPRQPNPHRPDDVPPEHPGHPDVEPLDGEEPGGGIPHGSGGNPPEDPPPPPPPDPGGN